MADDGERDSIGCIGVLIADSDRRVRQALRALLQTDPRLTISGEAGNVDELLQLAGRTHPALILLDVLLPRASNGLHAIAELSHTSNCPILILTNGVRWRDEALQAGASGVIDKDVDADEVLSAVLRLARGTNL